MKIRTLQIMLVALCFSCSEEIKPMPYTYTQNFTGATSKTWKLSFLEETLNGKVIGTFSVSCAADDQYTFYANSERLYEVKTGSLKCYQDPEPALISDTWTFNNATATLTMILPFFRQDTSLPFIVKEVRKNKMEVEIFLDEPNTRSYRVHFDALSEN